MVNDFPDITTKQISFVVSFALLGAAIGSLVSGAISDNYGRKPVILVADILFLVGSLTLAFAPRIWVLYVGRLLIGIGIGIAS